MRGGVSQLTGTRVVFALILLSACGGSATSSGPSPSPSSLVSNELHGVTCAYTSHCIAVGFSGRELTDARSLIEENTGSGWAIVPSPNPDGSWTTDLYGVACARPTQCVAVGRYLVGASVDKTLVEESSGSGWAIVPSPNPSAFGHSNGRLWSVTCASATHCIAVGEYESDTGFMQTLIEESSGSGWAIVPSPNTGSGQDNSLRGVACAMAGQCVAVGFIGAGQAQLIEENSGSGWTIVSVEGDGFLNGVSCAGPTYCVAVGYAGNALYGTERIRIVENTGSGWSAAAGAGGAGELFGVSCPRTTNCVTVGGPFEQKNETGWSVVPGPTPSGINMSLNGVVCTGTDHCLIVGSQYVGPDYAPDSKTLVVENDGSGWAVVNSPNVTAPKPG